MLTLLLIITMKLMALPPPWYLNQPEAPHERQERLETIVLATYLETRVPPKTWRHSPRDLFWAVMATTYEESRHWAVEVHDGRVKFDKGRSHCLGMIMRGTFVKGEKWKSLVGTDLAATRRCMRMTAKVLGHHSQRCLWISADANAWNMAKIFAGYATGYSCNAMFKVKDGFSAPRRAYTWSKLRKL